MLNGSGCWGGVFSSVAHLRILEMFVLAILMLVQSVAIPSTSLDSLVQAWVQRKVGFRKCEVFLMMFNPWAVVIFLFGGLVLYGSGLTETALVTVLFFLLVPAWILCGCIWDMITIRKQN